MPQQELIRYKQEPVGIGILHQMSVNETAPMHTHMDYFEVFLVVDGKALHVVNGHVDPLSAGSFVLVRPSDVHCYDFYPLHDFEFYNLSLNLQDFNKVLALYNHDPRLQKLLAGPSSPVLQLDEAGTLRTKAQILTIQALIDDNNHTDAKHRLKALLAELFCEQVLLKEAVASPHATVPAWLSELVGEMHKEENFVAGLPRMLALAGYSQEYLTRSCKKYLDLTPTQFINGLRLNHAAGLLRAGKADILAVSEDCGFNNASHFYHQFKKAYGTTPSLYRRRTAASGER